MVTLVERFSRHTLLAALPDGYDAANTAKTVTQALGKQPSHMMCILTWDHRREMTRWKDIAVVSIEVVSSTPLGGPVVSVWWLLTVALS